MFIRFTAENYLSFKEETEFNMLTGDIRRLPHHVLKSSKVDLLKSAVIYGANGAGKSNLLCGINLINSIVCEGDINSSSYSNLNKYKLSNYSEKSTKLEIEFITKGKGYVYGVEFNEDLIIEEWLYLLSFSEKKDDLVFERKTSKNGKSKIILNPKYLKSAKSKLLVKVYEEDFLKKNVPFIHLVKDKKFKEISEAYHWFENESLIIFPETRFLGFHQSLLENADFHKFTNKLIKELYTGVHELKVITLDFDDYFGEDNLSEKERILKKIMDGEKIQLGGVSDYTIALLENKKPIIKKLISIHKNAKGENVEFELFEESDGTLRLLDFIPALYTILKSPTTVFIDEIDQSIHPSLLKEFVKKIQEDESVKGQLIFTSHESNLLDLDLFRQDEIWFAEKNKEGATHFHPLSEYDIRPDLDIRKGYLSGRFGAIPFLANLKDLNWDKHEKKN